jgi:hypothetical protein
MSNVRWRARVVALVAMWAITSVADGQNPTPTTPEHAASQPARPDSGRDSIRDCVRKCAGGETMPELTSFPRIDIGDVPQSSTPTMDRPQGTGNLGQIGMHGTVVYTVVVRPDGSADRSTLRVVSSTAKDWEQVLQRALDEARFRPGSDARGAVRARVALTFDIRADGFGRLCLAAAVRPDSNSQRPLQSCYTGSGGG